MITGEIQLETGESRSPYEINQDKAIAYFDKLSAQLGSMQDGKIQQPSSLEEPVMNYLSGVYLFCLTKNGICPFILQTVLEVDIIQSRLTKIPTCKNMESFWKLWIKNGFEDRARYSVDTKNLMSVQDFNTNQRPRYIECKPTVEKEIQGAPADNNFFKLRYQDKKGPAHSVRLLQRFLQTIKEKKLNVFVEAGAENVAQGKVETRAQKSAGSQPQPPAGMTGPGQRRQGGR